jgi:release factor glutamine methyltransferase
MSDRSAPWTVRRLLEWTTGFFQKKNVDSPRLSAELLLAHVLDYPRIKLYTDYERELGDTQLKDFRNLVQRAGEQEPIAYLTGRAHFFSLEFEVGPGVLIPRPDTETLVESVIGYARSTPGLETPRILDLCTGSGCIAAALAKSLPAAVIVAADKSDRAAAVAGRNLERLGLADRVTVAVGDLFGSLADLVDVRPFDIITANPPYIPTNQIADLDRNVKDYEPLEALDGGIDGLTLHHRILREGLDRLTPGGRMYLEIQFDQADAAREAAAAVPGYDDVRILKDYGGNDRVLTVRKTA